MNKEVIIFGKDLELDKLKLDKLKDKDIIVVNDALFKISNPDYFITMDYNFIRKNYEHIDKYIINLPNRIFVTNLTNNYLKELQGGFVDTRYPLTYELWRFNIIIKSYQTGGIGHTFGYLQMAKVANIVLYN